MFKTAPKFLQFIKSKKFTNKQNRITLFFENDVDDFVMNFVNLDELMLTIKKN